MLNGFTAEHDDKRFSPVGIDIRNRMAEPLDQLGFTFLYHGTPLCMIIRNYCIFILFFHWVQVQILRMSNFFISNAVNIKRMFTVY